MDVAKLCRKSNNFAGCRSPAEQKEHVTQIVLRVAKDTLHADTLATDAPLMEAGHGERSRS